MAAMKELWADLLDRFEVWGEAEAIGQSAPLTDAALWGEAREALGDLLPEQPDADSVAELRDAYNEGRGCCRIDMDAVVERVRALGHHAYVEHTGGGTATIYAGRQVPDSNGDGRWSAAAGPGWFTAPGWSRPTADTSEFFVGPDDDGEARPRQVSGEATTEQIADLIVAVIGEVDAQRRPAPLPNA